MAAKEALSTGLERSGGEKGPCVPQAGRHTAGLSERLLTWFGATRRKIHRNTATSASWDSNPSRVGAVPSADTAALPAQREVSRGRHWVVVEHAGVGRTQA